MSNQHQYKNLTDDQYEELFSNYLIDSWSYSKVSQFARNEKAFEMSYVYNSKARRSASSVSGNAYHEALDFYFNAIKDKEKVDIIDLQQIAFEYIEEVPANQWKLQKTTPTILDCTEKSNKVVVSSLDNFMSEVSVYRLDDVKEIIGVEVYMDEFLTINGVDIPLPCHARLDLIFRMKDDKIVIIDHKSKMKFSDEKEIAFSSGKQAITYVHCVEAKYNVKVDEVWFIENKYSKNRDKSPQLICFPIVIDEDTRRLYDAMLYEPLRRTIQAVSDPDYVYLMNEDDNYVDRAELHAFWAQTMVAEVDDFDIPENKKEIIGKRLKKIRDASLSSINPAVITKFRKNASEFIQFNLNDKDMTREQKIEHVLRTLNIIVKVAFKFEGFSNDTFLLEASSGTKLSSVFKYKLDIANALNVSNIRIMKDLFVYENKSYISVEAAKKRESDLFYDPKYLVDLKIPIGIDNFKRTVFWDLDNHSTPHVLVCGATGSGKSVAIDSMLNYIFEAGIDDVVIFDPKYEFGKYKSKAEVFNDIDDIEAMMGLMVDDMNQRVINGTTTKKVIIFDEFADAISQASKGKDLDIWENVEDGFYKQSLTEREAGLPPQPKIKNKKTGTRKSLEENLKMLLQKGRSCGIRIIAATQRASVKVITGDAKVNFPVQICFMVPKEVDSKVVLDQPGAEALTGRGDGLINSPEYLDVVRFQSFYKP